MKIVADGIIYDMPDDATALEMAEILSDGIIKDKTGEEPPQVLTQRPINILVEGRKPMIKHITVTKDGAGCISDLHVEEFEKVEVVT
jgi:hypothetical protein